MIAPFFSVFPSLTRFRRPRKRRVAAKAKIPES